MGSFKFHFFIASLFCFFSLIASQQPYTGPSLNARPANPHPFFSVSLENKQANSMKIPEF